MAWLGKNESAAALLLLGAGAAEPVHRGRAGLRQEVPQGGRN